MYVRFHATGRLLKLFPKKKRYTLHEADKKLKEVARHTLKESSRKPVLLEIFESEEESIFLAEFEVGSEEASNFLLLIDTLFQTSFPNSSEQDKQRGLHYIEEAFQAEESMPLSPPKEMEEKSGKKIQQFFADKKRTFSFNGFKEVIEKLNLPADKMFGCIFLCVVLLVGGWLFPLYTNHSQQAQGETSTYQVLLKEKRYDELVEKYPSKQEEVLTLLFDKKDKGALKKIAQKEHFPLAIFYFSFLDKDWATVTTLKNLPQDSDIVAMKGYAFLKQGKVEEAKLINQEIKNKTLGAQILSYQKDQAYAFIHKQELSHAEQLNQEIHDSQLAEDIKIAKSIVNLLQKYQNDQKNTNLPASEREEAAKNYDIWKKNLQQVGKEKKD